jgi:hypothetical protein
VFEVSATATPMNAGTRVLSTKAAERDEPPSDAELRDQARALGLDVGRSVRDEWRDHVVHLLDMTVTERPNREKAKRPERKTHEPIQIASFEC